MHISCRLWVGEILTGSRAEQELEGKTLVCIVMYIPWELFSQSYLVLNQYGTNFTIMYNLTTLKVWPEHDHLPAYYQTKNKE